MFSCVAMYSRTLIISSDEGDRSVTTLQRCLTASRFEASEQQKMILLQPAYLPRNQPI
uniref:Uncharacterized protein n=1 Tax=Arundo donax TaxID=35708 RepID=A0A0A9GNQ9_ARUDO